MTTSTASDNNNNSNSNNHSNSINTPITTLCRNYALRGKCRFGTTCRYSHALPDDCTSWEDACSRMPCPHYQKGSCRYGPMCRLAHLDDDVNVVSSSDEDAHRQEQITTTTTTTNSVEEEEEEEECICGICLDPLGNTGSTASAAAPTCVVIDGAQGTSPPPPSTATSAAAAAASSSLQETPENKSVVQPVQRKKFGLLTGCTHVFCIDCIRHWRKEQKRVVSETPSYMIGEDTPSPSDRVRACPTCRRVSDFVVPSDRFCVGQEKTEVIGAYQARLSVQKCKRFNGKFGSCPFGRDCFYAHKRHGKDVKRKDKSKKELWEKKQRRNRSTPDDAWTRSHEALIEEATNNLFRMSGELLSGEQLLPDLPTLPLQRVRTRPLNRGSRRPSQSVEEALQSIIEEHRISMEMFRLAMADV
eukprot:CAMPEP_0113509618 /NCGR_PEP_ID=MMETSP0014_2-20120614/37676_1 /TAXON_ID=2857 /ORGANISM="Nitzschia sp." /LENGTH=415 /DNA_ID=CAMNT_0000405469 /DNA_START=227 /DNA_END=1474 /DNA_ORIENTATION=- /assembly_acc=CAM_ASM_000159